MKRYLLCTLLALLALGMQAQSITILHSMDMLQNATALTHYSNLFGSFQMPEKDDPFPFVVIRIDLEGDANAVRLAKQQLNLDLGRLKKVESMDKGQPNTILYLIESSVKNIYLTCGDGCQSELLYTGSLQSNRIYTCRVQYNPEVKYNPGPNSGSANADNDEMKQMMLQLLEQNKQMQEQNKQMQEQNKALQEQMQQIQQNQSTTVSNNKANPSAPISKSTPSAGNNLTFTIKRQSFTMVSVQGGTFTMGATSEQGSDASSDEKPAHSGTLSDYYIGQTEVTQGLWQAVMGSNPSYFKKGDSYPVEEVSWDDCQDFIRKLNSQLSSQLGGKRFALPTEAQWEYAARGGG